MHEAPGGPISEQGGLGIIPCRPQVHEQVAVVHPRHPDQLLVTRHRVPISGGERLEFGKLSLEREKAENVSRHLPS